jgi:hypothetical protein
MKSTWCNEYRRSLIIQHAMLWVLVAHQVTNKNLFPNFTILLDWAIYKHNSTDSVLDHQKIHAWQAYIRGVNVVQPLCRIIFLWSMWHRCCPLIAGQMLLSTGWLLQWQKFSKNFLNVYFDGRWLRHTVRVEYPPWSPNFPHLNFHLWDTLKNKVHAKKMQYLRQKTESACAVILS